jgi:hypothetical protein
MIYEILVRKPSLIDLRFRFDQLKDAGFPQCSFDKKLMKSVSEASVLREWRIKASDKAKRTKTNAEVPLYLSVDVKPVVVVRARLRLGSALTPSRHFVYGHAGSPFCQHSGCVAKVGTAYHMFVECPRFESARAVCVRRLKEELYFPVSFSIEVILGKAPAPPANLAKERAFLQGIHARCLEITGDFISTVNRMHPL